MHQTLRIFYKAGGSDASASHLIVLHGSLCRLLLENPKALPFSNTP